MDKGKYLRTHQNVHKTSEKNSFFRDVCVSCGSLTHRLCDMHSYPVYQALLNKPLAFFSLFSRIHHQVRYVLLWLEIFVQAGIICKEVSC